jgi:hypothetical protein
MTPKLTPPIFVVTASEVLVFRGVDLAARYMEPIDIRNGEYEAAYDSAGRRLKPTVRQNERQFLSLLPEEVSSLVVVDGPTQPLELAAALRKFLAGLGQDRVTLDRSPLEDLAAKTVAATGYTD